MFQAAQDRVFNAVRQFTKPAVKAVTVATGTALVLVGRAHAAVDASVGTAFTALKDDAIALAAIVTPIVVAILGLVLVIKLIKRFGSKI